MSFVKLCAVSCLIFIIASCDKPYVQPDNVIGKDCSLSGTVEMVLELEGGYVIKSDDGVLLRPKVDLTRPCPVMYSIEIVEGMRVVFSYKDLEYIVTGIEEGAPDALAVNLLCLGEEGGEADPGHK